MNRAKVILASYLGVLAYASLVFIGAWKLHYGRGLLYLGLALTGTTVSHLLVPRDSDLTVRRARDAAAGQRWDRRLLGLLALVSAATFLIAGLDSGHFGWSSAASPALTAAAAVLMLTGQLVFALAKRQNTCFSSTVRIQADPAQDVCESGLYRLVRHPGYAGLLLATLAFPPLMGSWWAYVPAAAAAALLIIRTVREDRFLLTNLPGYRDYAARTQARLIPGVF